MRESTREREARFRAERYAAMRAAITPEMRAFAAVDGPDAEYPAGERVTIRAGRQRPEEVDEGELRRLALADSLRERGWTIISHGVSFGLFAGRQTLRYRVTARRDGVYSDESAA